MLHLLLIKDNPADVLMVREALRASSIAVDVMIAYDGEQALRLLCEMHFKPDFIILDLSMPKFDGFAVLEQYRAQDGPPVVVFTSSRNEQDKQRALALGDEADWIPPIHRSRAADRGTLGRRGCGNPGNLNVGADRVLRGAKVTAPSRSN